jgi:hypothetical protein
MLVIPATQEAEIRRIWVQSQPQANSMGDPISKILITRKKGLMEWFTWQIRELLFFLFLVGLGFELRASRLQSSFSAT